MSWIPMRSGLLVGVVGLGLLACCTILFSWHSAEASPAPIHLDRDSIAQGKLPADQGKSYSITLKAKQFLHLVAEQLGADVELFLIDPSGQELYQVDSPSQDTGAEHIFFVAPSDGEYKVEVRDASKGKYSGRYRIFIQELRESTLKDQKNAKAEESFYRAKSIDYKDFQGAEKRYRKSIQLWREINNRIREGDSFCGLGDVSISQRHWRQAIDAFKQCAASRADGKDLRGKITALQGIAQAEESLGNLIEEEKLYETVLHLFSILHISDEVVKAEYKLATIQIGQGKASQAFEHLNQVIEISQRKDRGLWLKALMARGKLYESLGKADLALDDLERSYALADKPAYSYERAIILTQEANIYGDRREFAKAVDLLKKALTLRRAAGNVIGEGNSLSSLGILYYRAGRFDDALSAFQRAEQIFEKEQVDARRMVALRSLAWVHAVQGRQEMALKIFYEALPLAQKGGDRPAESAILYGIAYSERRKGNPITSGARIDDAIQVMESLRSSAERRDLRASFLADREDLYGFKIALLMDQHALKPKAGYDLQAFQTSERARARGLYEALVKEGAGIKAADRNTILQRHRLQDEINRQDLALRHPRLSDRSRSEILLKLHESIALDEEVESKIRDVAGPIESLNLLPSLSLWEIQNKVLDKDTILLEYYIAKGRVFLWAISPGSFHGYEIRCPDLQDAVERTYSMWSRGDSRAGSSVDVDRLSQCLLQPVVGMLGEKRLVIVPHDELQKIPFEALSDPAFEGSDKPPLTLRHEVVNVPSISVLSMLRKQRGGHSPAPIFLSLMADPVYGLNDDRLPADKDARSRPVGKEDNLRTLDLSRLRASQKEADAILNLSRGRPVEFAMGFKANREWALTGHLQNARIVHLALHGSINNEEPKLSGLVLSQFDSKGRRIDGLLRAHEIEDLKFSADLIVLSACKSGLGKDLRGEGLISLSQSFLSGGALSVVASLWKVDDLATAELMERFYRGLISEGLSPASALRKAQMEMWRDAHWQDPYYWAGFILQGEWRGRQEIRATPQ